MVSGWTVFAILLVCCIIIGIMLLIRKRRRTHATRAAAAADKNLLPLALSQLAGLNNTPAPAPAPAYYPQVMYPPPGAMNYMPSPPQPSYYAGMPQYAAPVAPVATTPMPVHATLARPGTAPPGFV